MIIVTEITKKIESYIDRCKKEIRQRQTEITCKELELERLEALKFHIERLEDKGESK